MGLGFRGVGALETMGLGSRMADLISRLANSIASPTRANVEYVTNMGLRRLVYGLGFQIYVVGCTRFTDSGLGFKV